MKRYLAILLLFALGCASGGNAPLTEAPTSVVTFQNLTPEARLAYLREATVWSPIDTAKLDLKAGPPGGEVAPDATLECDFVLLDPDKQRLREIEVDDSGNVYVLSAHQLNDKGDESNAYACERQRLNARSPRRCRSAGARPHR